MERLSEHRRNLLIAVARTISMLSCVPHWRTVIEDVLRPICEATRSDRAILLRFEGEAASIYSCRVAIWMPPGDNGVSPEAFRTLTRFPLVGDGHNLMHHYQAYLTGHAVTFQYSAALSESDRWLMELSRSHSKLRMPIFVHGKLWGLIGLDVTVRQRLWLDAELTALCGLASVLGAMIERDGD